jgi:hypothetical protein
MQKFSEDMYRKVGSWKNENINVITIKWISEKYTKVSQEHVQ